MTHLPWSGEDLAVVLQAGRLRPAWAEVDLGAICHNAAVLASAASPARLCAVVKAGGYGHGSAPVARAALAGGASHLAVALVEEGCQLREAGIEAPILVLSEAPKEAVAEVVAAGLTPTVYTRRGAEALVAAVRAAGRREALPVHVKVDTGMHRVGADPLAAVDLALEVVTRPELELEGFWTHLAVADEVDDPYTGEQLARYGAAVAALAASGVRPPLLHAANSAGTLWHPGSHLDLVRCGIALYGLSPAGPGGVQGSGVAGRRSGGPGERSRPVVSPFDAVEQLRPALALKARVSYAKRLAAGERLSYGLRYRLSSDSVVATVPLGYADGVTRSLSAAGGEVLIGGRRRPIAGTVTMDQIMVDCGSGADVVAGDEVVLLGCQGDERIDAWDWATRTGTIAYEVVCGVSGRVPRTYVGAP